MSGYPDHETYKALYKRFYDGRQPKELIDLVGNINNKAILDMCGGDGRLSLEALKLGARQVFYMDEEPKMESPELKDAYAKDLRLFAKSDSAIPFLEMISNSAWKFDAIFCQQAVNYWLDEYTGNMVASALNKNGLFIFNTFNKKPPDIPKVKEYELEGKKFVEASWMFNDIVHHVQIREGLPPHTTSFQWLSPEYLEKILSPYFSITVQNDGSSAIYRCSKK